MNNSCPSCGATYNITAAMIGREVVCKKCNSELVITEAGIELKDAPPPPPARRGSSGYNAAPAAPSRRPAARVEEEPEEEAYDEEEAPAPRSGSRYGKSGRPRRRSSGGGDGGFGDFASFRTLITPTVIVIVYWILTGVLVLGGLVVAGLALSNGFMAGAFLGLFYMIIGPFVIRFYCEIIIVMFRVYSTLVEILQELKSQR